MVTIILEKNSSAKKRVTMEAKSDFQQTDSPTLWQVCRKKVSSQTETLNKLSLDIKQKFQDIHGVSK